MTRASLGLDTSCYTTSAALCCLTQGAAAGRFFQARKLLTVPLGERGLAQSEGVFQHVARLPELLAGLLEESRDLDIACVCASVKPRPREDSYMPVFRVGEGTGRAVAAALRVPLYGTTHQEGHIRAARVDTALTEDTPFLALHLSGGTTEILRVSPDGGVALLGGTRDLHAGQLIDRVGVRLGLPFPAGPHLEALARKGEAKARLSASLRGMDCHFSGAETEAMRWAEREALPREDIAAEVFDCVSRTVARLIVAAWEATGVRDALLLGGVASSALIGGAVRARVAKRAKSVRLHFARPELAGDNAVGVALIGAERLRKDVGRTNH